MKKILMVCLGNICRSPMAEGIMRHKAQEAGIEISLDSAGTGNYHVGEAPDHRAIRCMKERGIDISRLRARQFRRSDFAEFDIIYAMDESNKTNILALASNDEDRKKVRMLLGESQSVPDPWFGVDDGFNKVYDMVDKACGGIIKEWVAEH